MTMITHDYWQYKVISESKSQASHKCSISDSMNKKVLPYEAPEAQEVQQIITNQKVGGLIPNLKVFSKCC